MSKSPSQHLVRSQRKLKLIERGKNLNIRQFLIFFAIFQCTGRQQNWVADLVWSVNRVKYLNRLVYKKCIFKFRSICQSGFCCGCCYFVIVVLWLLLLFCCCCLGTHCLTLAKSNWDNNIMEDTMSDLVSCMRLKRQT